MILKTGSQAATVAASFCAYLPTSCETSVFMALPITATRFLENNPASDRSQNNNNLRASCDIYGRTVRGRVVFTSLIKLVRIVNCNRKYGRRCSVTLMGRCMRSCGGGSVQIELNRRNQIYGYAVRLQNAYPSKLNKPILSGVDKKIIEPQFLGYKSSLSSKRKYKAKCGKIHKMCCAQKTEYGL